MITITDTNSKALLEAIGKLADQVKTICQNQTAIVETEVETVAEVPEPEPVVEEVKGVHKPALELVNWAIYVWPLYKAKFKPSSEYARLTKESEDISAIIRVLWPIHWENKVAETLNTSVEKRKTEIDKLRKEMLDREITQCIDSMPNMHNYTSDYACFTIEQRIREFHPEKIEIATAFYQSVNRILNHQKHKFDRSIVYRQYDFS